jgi:hypothetical protein
LAKPIKIQLEHTDKVKMQLRFWYSTQLHGMMALQCTEEPQCVYWNSTPKGNVMESLPLTQVFIMCYWNLQEAAGQGKDVLWSLQQTATQTVNATIWQTLPCWW